MQRLPVVQSNVQILRVEVWVTNRTGATTDTRDVVGFMDLGENRPFNQRWSPLGQVFPDNGSNDLYRTVVNTPGARNSSDVQTILSSNLGLQPVQDFEKTFARKLQPTDYYYNPQIGFLSLNQQLQPDEVLGVAYQYTYNGKVFPGGGVFAGRAAGQQRQHHQSTLPKVAEGYFAAHQPAPSGT
jgi:cell surface protein SprA